MTTVAVDGTWLVTLNAKLTVPMTASITQKLAHTEASEATTVRFRPWAD